MASIKTWLIVLGGLFLILVAAELWLPVQDAAPHRAVKHNFLKFSRVDPELGWVGRPKQEGLTRTREGDRLYQVKLNSLGLRSPELTTTTGLIALMGDSVPYGYGEDQDALASSVLRERFGDRVVNLALLGGSPVSYYLWLERQR